MSYFINCLIGINWESANHRGSQNKDFRTLELFQSLVILFSYLNVEVREAETEYQKEIGFGVRVFWEISK